MILSRESGRSPGRSLGVIFVSSSDREGHFFQGKSDDLIYRGRFGFGQCELKRDDWDLGR